ncbi:DUF1351 domain-containing protein [Bengtsoniella intestinalis]|uniref:DUF1351 domain-containing protein n=1 Tax=Bengtsoniella intestinalis TaxID=3073143 RepID=UPI00391EE80D
MSSELIIVRQLPIIEEKLRSISEEMKTRTDEALSLAVTEDTVKQIKRVRADLGKSFKELEEARKSVKKEVMAPYEEFEKQYKTYITDVFAPTDATLKGRIAEVEDGVKEEKRAEAQAFFDEYAVSVGVNFVKYEDAGFKVTLSSTAKALQAAVKEFLDRIADDLVVIDTHPNSDEVLVEYKQCLNIAKSITTVANRHEAIEAERKRQEEQRIQREAQANHQHQIEELLRQQAQAVPAPQVMAAPQVVPQEAVAPAVEQQQVYQSTFTVTGTKEQLRAVRDFLINGGYTYEAK